MGRTKRPAVLLLVLGTLLAVVSTTEGSNSTKPQGQGIPLNSFVLNQIAQNILTDPDALDNYLQRFLPNILKSLPKPASNSTASPTSALLRKILMDMAGLYTNQTQPTDDIGLAEAQLVEMLRESMKNPVVRGIVVQMAQTLITEVRLDCQLRQCPEVMCKTYFMLNSTEHRFSTAHKSKLPTHKEISYINSHRCFVHSSVGILIIYEQDKFRAQLN